VLERLVSLREGSIIVVAIVVAVYFAINTSSFLTGENFKTLLPYFAPLAILGAGEVFVMILGEIDLSIAAMYLFAPIVFFKLDSAGLGLVPSVLLALIACMAVGVVNGAFVSIVGVSSFVTTLGMLRRRLLRADLGDRDRAGAAGRADVHSLGPLHGRDRLEQARRG